jgi:hypothetical protein
MKITRRFYCHLGYVALFFLVSYFVELVALSQSLKIDYSNAIYMTWQPEACRLFIFLFFRSLFLGVKEELTYQELESYKKARAV